MAILITGGGILSFDPTEAQKSAEIFIPNSNTSCSLPDLPDKRFAHTQDGPLLCGGYSTDSRGKSCLKWNPENGSWVELESKLKKERYAHSSWTPLSGKGTYIIGGRLQTMGELVKPDGTIKKGFNTVTSLWYATIFILK